MVDVHLLSNAQPRNVRANVFNGNHADPFGEGFLFWFAETMTTIRMKSSLSSTHKHKQNEYHAAVGEHVHVSNTPS